MYIEGVILLQHEKRKAKFNIRKLPCAVRPLIGVDVASGLAGKTNWASGDPENSNNIVNIYFLCWYDELNQDKLIKHLVIVVISKHCLILKYFDFII